MKLKILLLIATTQSINWSLAQNDPKTTEIWEPVPQKVKPGTDGSPPSDATILFNGEDLSAFESVKGGPAKWKLADGAMTVAPGTGAIRTKQKFADCQLHIEWRSPVDDNDEGQGKGNSGVFLMERYEVQVLDSYQGKTYPNGQAGSIYKQYIPLVNPLRPIRAWNAYDIIFTAPVFGKKDNMIAPARFTVLLNGVLIQNNVSLLGPTEYIGTPVYKKHEDGAPILLQDHTDEVSFRNIWIREL